MSRKPGVRSPTAPGFSLVEVAVSLLLISIATLGLAGLQLSARAMGFQALQRSEAAALATDLLERMRANRGALDSYTRSGADAAPGDASPPPVRDCGGGPCSAAELAEWDMLAWQQALDGAPGGGLVRPRGCVSLNGRVVTVEIAWEGQRDFADPDPGNGCGSGHYGTGDERRQLLRLVTFIGEDP